MKLSASVAAAPGSAGPTLRFLPLWARAGWVGVLLFCWQAMAAVADPVAVTDFRGRNVALAAPAERIVCLLESALSGLYMLGAGSRVAGVATSVYQETLHRYYAQLDDRVAARSLPAPGNWDFVNIESVVALRPDLVVVWSGQEESIAALEEKGIPVFGVAIERFADIRREIEALGRLTGTDGRAAELLRLADSRLAELHSRRASNAGRPPVRVYFMWAQGPLETSGRLSAANELIELAGGTNVAAGSSLEHLVVNLESVLLWNPEVVAMWCNDRLDPADIAELPGWRSLAAVRQQRVHELPDAFSCDFWTLKYLHAAQRLAAWCDPHGATSPDLDQARDALFAALYGRRLAAPPAPAGADSLRAAQP